MSPIGPFPLQTADNPNGFPGAVVESVRASWKQDFTAWVEASADAYVGRGLPGCEVSPGISDWTIRDMLQTSLLAVVECNRACIDTDLRAEMTEIRVPTLIIQGDHDASIPAELSGHVAARLIPGATFRLYEDAPHGLYLTHRDRLADDIAHFVDT